MSDRLRVSSGQSPPSVAYSVGTGGHVIGFAVSWACAADPVATEAAADPGGHVPAP